MSDLQEILLTLEAAAWEASSSGNGDWYRENLTEDAQLVFPGVAEPMSRTECADVVDAAMGSWEWYRMEDVRLIGLGAEAAVLSYHAVARREGETSEYIAQISSGYARVGVGWKLAFHQQTPMSGAN